MAGINTNNEQKIEMSVYIKGERAICIPCDVVEKQLPRNPITRDLFLTRIGHFPCAKQHYYERKDGIDEYILIYVSQGRGWIECDGERSLLLTNQAFIIPADMPHNYGANPRDPWTIYWLHFKGERAAQFNSIYKRVLDIQDTVDSRLHDRIQLFEDMFRNLEMGYNMENMEYISYCLSYFLASIKYLEQYRLTKNVKIDDPVQRSILFMKENLENKITLQDISDHICYSPSHLSTLFLQKTSCSPMTFYNHLRIQRACSYLQLSDLKIKEIAFRLGFYDPFHFSKAFLKEMQITPKEYRKKYKVQSGVKD